MKNLLRNKFILFLLAILIFLIIYHYVYPICSSLIEYRSSLKILFSDNKIRPLSENNIIRIDNSKADISLNKLNLKVELKCIEVSKYKSFCIAPESIERNYGIKTISLENPNYCSDTFRIYISNSNISCKDIAFEILTIKPIDFNIFDNYNLVNKELLKMAMKNLHFFSTLQDEFIILTEKELFYVIKHSKEEYYNVYLYWNLDYVYKIETNISDKNTLVESMKRIKI